MFAPPQSKTAPALLDHPRSAGRFPGTQPHGKAAGTILNVGSTDEPLERDADRAAGRVIGTRVSENSVAQTSQSLSSGKAPAIVSDVVRSAGQPLDMEERARFEQHFRRDFGQVRVHTGELAAQSAKAMDAAAYSLGRHVVLGAGKGLPGSVERPWLLAHELAHVAQYESGAPEMVRRQPAGSGPLPITPMDPRHARGYAGEQTMGFGYSEKDGWIFVEGPSGAAGHGVTEPGFDGVAYNIPADELHLADNKSLAAVTARNASALTKNLLRNMDGLIVRVRAARDMKSRIKILGLLTRARAAIAAGTPVPKNFKLVITGEGGQAVRISRRLQQQGIIFRNPGQVDTPLAASTPAARQASGEIDAPDTAKAGPDPSAQPKVLIEDDASRAGVPAEAREDTSQAGEPEPSAGGVHTGEGPDFVPKSFRFGSEVAEGLIVGLIADYFASKILSYFQHKRMVEALEAMQPEIQQEKQNAIQQSPPAIRKLIEHPVWGNARQFYWVITIRLRTNTTIAVGGGRAVAMTGTVPELVSPVRISEKSQSGTGATEQGKTVAGPALHAVVLLQDSHTVTYSQPIISWNAELPAGMKDAIEEMRSRHAETVDVLKFRASGQQVTVENLLAWAKRNFPGKLGGPRIDPIVAENIMSSNEFAGSDDARGRALEALALKLRGQ
jgi:Domain of unknown function (DUF4157)